jgi:hypothetical protein
MRRNAGRSSYVRYVYCMTPGMKYRIGTARPVFFLGHEARRDGSAFVQFFGYCACINLIKAVSMLQHELCK